MPKIFEKSFWLLRNLFRSFFKHSQPSFQDRATTVESALNDIVNVLTAEESWHLKPGILVSIHLFLQCFVLHDTVTLEQILERWGQLPTYCVDGIIFFLYHLPNVHVLYTLLPMAHAGCLPNVRRESLNVGLDLGVILMLLNQECSYLTPQHYSFGEWCKRDFAWRELRLAGRLNES